CRPDIRSRVTKGDWIFVVSGRISGAEQYVIGGLQVREKISALQAFSRYPEHRLHRDADGVIVGNIVCDGDGSQHKLDHHKDFGNRIANYIVGRDPIHVLGDPAIATARLQTLEFLKSILGKNGDSIITVMGRASKLDEMQTDEMIRWLRTIQQTQ